MKNGIRYISYGFSQFGSHFIKSDLKVKMLSWNRKIIWCFDIFIDEPAIRSGALYQDLEFDRTFHAIFINTSTMIFFRIPIIRLN